MRTVVVVGGLVGLSFGCSSGTAWLPAGAIVPSPSEAELAAIDENDGVGREVLPVSGFAEGDPQRYWDFGVVPDAGTMPMYFLCRRSGAACTPVDHPPIAEHLPGEDGYAHFGRVHEVEVTDAWAGQVVPSRAAIDDAVRDGLVRAPVVSNRYAHCPMVHPDVLVDLGDGTDVGPDPIYVRGVAASCVPFWTTHGLRPLEDVDEGLVVIRNVYPLFREGETMPISEVARGVDLTGDGDTLDTNTVLGVGYGLEYTPLWRMVRVTVASDYASIDTAMDETMATYRAATDMFTIDPTTYEIEPIGGRIVAHELTDTLIDCPEQSAPGEL